MRGNKTFVTVVKRKALTFLHIPFWQPKTTKHFQSAPSLVLLMANKGLSAEKQKDIYVLLLIYKYLIPGIC